MSRDVFYCGRCGEMVDLDDLTQHKCDIVSIESKKEEIELDLDDQTFLIIAKQAHERDITFNEMANIILKEELFQEK